jgi:hypothetical protein
MRWFIWGLVLPASLTAFSLVLFRAFLRAGLLRQDSLGRERFRFEREALEARFLAALEREDPVERLRWEDAQWHDEVIWGRDRKTRRLLALIGVHFEPEPFAAAFLPEAPAPHATVIFEFRDGHWRTDGKRLDEIHPHEAFLRHQRFEPIVAPPPPRTGLV